MPKPFDPSVVKTYIESFEKFPSLKNNGFSFLIDCSGKLYKCAKPTLKDVEVNVEAGVCKCTSGVIFSTAFVHD